MKRYSEFRPTSLDGHIPVEDREDWFVAPVARNRDSGTLDLSNFESALEMLGGEGVSVEVHRFGHWAHGWFEIILVHPHLAGQVEEIEATLEYYPVLDDEDYSRREWEEDLDSWDSWGRREVLAALAKDFGLSEATREWLDVDDRLWQLYQTFGRGTDHDDSGPSFDRSWIAPLTRDDLAGWIRGRRREERAVREAEDAAVGEILGHAAPEDREAAFLAAADRLE